MSKERLIKEVRNAIILASGHGTRMKLITNGMLPKQLLCLSKDKPIIHFSLAALPDNIENIFIIIGSDGEKIQEACGENFQGKPIRYLEQPECNGTAAAVMKAKEYIHEPFLVINGDDLYSKEDLTALAQYQWAMLGFQKSKATRIGELVINEDMRLEDIRGVQDSDKKVIVCAGAYIFQPEFFETEMVQIPSGEFGLSQTLLKLAQEKKADVQVHVANFWMPINNPMEFVLATLAIQNKAQF